MTAFYPGAYPGATLYPTSGGSEPVSGTVSSGAGTPTAALAATVASPAILTSSAVMPTADVTGTLTALGTAAAVVGSVVSELASAVTATADITGSGELPTSSLGAGVHNPATAAGTPATPGLALVAAMFLAGQLEANPSGPQALLSGDVAVLGAFGSGPPLPRGAFLEAAPAPDVPRPGQPVEGPTLGLGAPRVQVGAVAGVPVVRSVTAAPAVAGARTGSGTPTVLQSVRPGVPAS